MSRKPVLETIRAILKFKASTTIAEIASMAGLKRMHVLNVVNDNLECLKRSPKRGTIIGVDCETPLRNQLWNSGKFWKPDTYGAWSVEGHSIRLHENQKDLADRLKSSQIVGGFGDSYYVDVIRLTPDNTAAVEAAGIRPWSEAVIDDRLWKEVANG